MTVEKKRVLGLAFLGALFSLSFAPFYFWWLGIACFAGLFSFVLRAQTVRQAMLYGFSFLFTHFVVSIHWIINAFYIDFGHWGYALALGVPSILVLSIYLAFYGVFTIAFFKKMPLKMQNPVVFAFLWVLFEIIRTYFPKTFSWHLVGYAWSDALPFLQLAAFGEVWLMSFVFVLASCFFGVGVRKGFVLAGLLLLMVFSAGSYRLSGSEKEDTELGLRLLLVQPNIPQKEKWQHQFYGTHFRRHIDLSQKGGDFLTDLVVWPEMSVLFDVTAHERLRNVISTEVGNKWVLFGGVRFGKKENGRVPYAHNAVFLMSPEGDVVEEFDKQLLIPYGEYLPFRHYLPTFMLDLWGARLDYVPGKSNRMMHLPKGKRADVLVCGEAVMPFLLHKHSASDMIINITNDAWFEGSWGPAQHFAMARVRAVALGKPFVRVGNTGITGLIDAKGRVLKTLKPSTAGNLAL